MNLPLLVAVPVVIWLAIDYLAADYFMVLMKRYNVNPVETHQMFLDAVHRYILWSSAGGLLLALALSVVLTRRVLEPLAAVSRGAGRIAHGDYGARVEVRGTDEVAALGRAFNAMADHLERIEALRKTLVADVAHELRTPLTNMRGYFEAMRDGVVEPSAEQFAMLQQEVLRLVRLVDDLGQLTRADAAGSMLRKEPVQLEQLVDEACAIFGTQLALRNVEVVRRVAPGLAPIAADRARLLQVMSNLLDNALTHTPDGGSISVSASAHGGAVQLAVDNTGAEIPAADLPFIFERFYRVDKSRSRASGGAGIGLAIVKQLVEAHGGMVGAESRDGTTRIWFALPA